MTLSVIFYPYHVVRAILSIPFCPMPFCPYTILSIPFCPYHFVCYHFVLEPVKYILTATCSTEKLVNFKEIFPGKGTDHPEFFTNDGSRCPACVQNFMNFIKYILSLFG